MAHHNHGSTPFSFGQPQSSRGLYGSQNGAAAYPPSRLSPPPGTHAAISRPVGETEESVEAVVNRLKKEDTGPKRGYRACVSTIVDCRSNVLADISSTIIKSFHFLKRYFVSKLKGSLPYAQSSVRSGGCKCTFFTPLLQVSTGTTDMCLRPLCEAFYTFLHGSTRLTLETPQEATR